MDLHVLIAGHDSTIFRVLSVYRWIRKHDFPKMDHPIISEILSLSDKRQKLQQLSHLFSSDTHIGTRIICLNLSQIMLARHTRLRSVFLRIIFANT